jgi:hypothetical protein
MVPATNAIMGALPLGKASVGSAVNDTSQEIGNALGVAILGSVLAASYHAAIDHAQILTALPGSITALVHDSIGSASDIASHIGGSLGQNITSSANIAFIHGMSQMVLVAAGVSLCGALIALIFLPSKTKDTRLTEQEPATTMEQQKEEAPIE